jgi:hypothetical protein
VLKSQCLDRPIGDREQLKAEIAASRILLRVLQTRYGISSDHVYAHDWIDYKDSRYCEGCQLAKLARTQNMESAAPVEKTP